MNLVIGITTKNEDWILDKSLPILSSICDKIVVLDDNSTDKTEEICRSFDKVHWNTREKREHVWQREEAKGLSELFTISGSYSPEYIMLLDADEIPTPSFINFFDNIDGSINAWSVRMINVFQEGRHYRFDSFTTPNGTNVNHDPFCDKGWRKNLLLKYNSDYNYMYDFTKQKGSTSLNHPAPKNIPAPIMNTEDFYVVHYGRINPQYVSGGKDRFYATIETYDGKGDFEERLIHHGSCRTGSGPSGPQYVECPSSWFWTQ